MAAESRRSHTPRRRRHRRLRARKSLDRGGLCCRQLLSSRPVGRQEWREQPRRLAYWSNLDQAPQTAQVAPRAWPRARNRILQAQDRILPAIISPREKMFRQGRVPHLATGAGGAVEDRLSHLLEPGFQLRHAFLQCFNARLFGRQLLFHFLIQSPQFGIFLGA
jgi:hypothetical protein